MKKASLILFSLGAILAIATTLAAANKKSTATAPQPDVAELKQQLASLQSKVEALEQKLDQLEKQKSPAVQSSNPFFVLPPAGGAGVTLPQNAAPLSGNFADPNRPPKIWGEGECNGWKYYVIPLNCQTAAN